MSDVSVNAVDPAPKPIPPWFRGVLTGLLVLAFIHALVVLAIGIDEPLIDLHEFRQTQTALSTYWLLQGGPRLAYETPVVGAPWSIPFEFPLFQYLVALVSRCGVPLDAAGRLTSFAFFLGALWPLRMLFRYLKLDGPAFLLTAILFLTCPLLLYWGRAFLMESCAVFFGLLWLALVVRYIDERRVLVAVAATAAGCVAVLVKSTTFPAFAFVGGMLVAIRIGQAWRRREPWLALTALSALFGLLPFGIGSVWVVFSDVVKSRNDIGQSLTSAALTEWNFGTVSQKLGSVLWVDTVWARALPDALGLAFLLGIAALSLSLRSPRHRVPVALCVAAFVLPFVVFTNLHIVHNYYQSANAIFIVAAVGIALASVAVTMPQRLTLVLLGGIAAGQIAMFYNEFFPFVRLTGQKDRLYQLSLLARDMTNPSQSLIVIGDNWSSTVPYYSQRKSLVLPVTSTAATVDKILADPQASLADRPLGAVVYCADRLASYGNRAPAIERFVSGREVMAEFGGCVLLSPDRKTEMARSSAPSGE